MSGLKKLFNRKENKAKNAQSIEDLSQSGREMASGAAGYVVSKEKDLPKLHKAVWSKDMAKLKQVIKKGDINQLDKENRTALHLAAAMGNDEMCRFLLTNKAKTNLCDNFGRTPLMKAVEAQSYNCSEMLLEHGADANVIDVMNSTSMHLASANGEIEIAVLLIGKGAKVSVQDKEGFTPLHVASSLGYQDFVGFLMHEGASIDAIDAHGRTSLMTAASEGHIGIVKLLLQNNANTELRDGQGWKASDHAIIQGHHSCSNIIEEHEEKLEAQQRPATTAKTGRKAINNNNSLSGLVDGEDVGFTFGGPAKDMGADSTSERDHDSASHHSHDENSWNSSIDEDMSDASKPPAKPSLLAAFKSVKRSESDASAHSQPSVSRIPVRKDSITSNTSQVSKQVTPEKPISRIPVPTTTSISTGSPKTPKKLEQSSISNQSTPSSTAPRTPIETAEQTPFASSVSTPKMGRAEPSSRLSAAGQQSLPWASIVPSDDESQISESDASEKLAGLLDDKSPIATKGAKDSKVNIFLTESRDKADDKESELDLSFSDDDDDDINSSFGLPINDEIDIVAKDVAKESKNTEKNESVSTEKSPIVQKHAEDVPRKAEGIPKLDLGSSVSSVSDPDLSQSSIKKNKKPKYGGDVSLSEDTDWDSSDDDILPSDDPGTTGGSSLFASSKRITPLPKVNDPKTQAKTPQLVKTNPDSDSEATETESEWEKERASKKRLEKVSHDDTTVQEEARLKQWEDEQAAREEAMALEVQKELEMELEMERLEREAEGRKKLEEEEERERQRVEREEQERRDEELRLLQEENEKLRQYEEEKLQREKEERARVEETLRTLEMEREQERLRIEREKEEELERQMRLKEEEMMRIQQENESERQRVEEEQRRIRLQEEVEQQRVQLERERELERQMRVKEEEMESQKKAYEERLEQERKMIQNREAEEASKRREEALRNEELEKQRQQELQERQKKIKEEEDNLLEAYRKKQEELLEQERRFEEEMARRERELEEKMKSKEFERTPVIEEVLVSSHDVHPTESSYLQSAQHDIFTSPKRAVTKLHNDTNGNQLNGHESVLDSMTVERVDPQEMKSLDESIRRKKAEKELLEEQRKAHQDITDQHALEVKIEIEKKQLHDLETRKEILDKQVGAKLTELANRKRRDELEEKSRQLMQEREALNASFEAAKKRSAMLDTTPEDASREDGDGLSRTLHTDKERGSSLKPVSNGIIDDVDWSESSEEEDQMLSPSVPLYSSSVPRFQSTAKADGQIELPVTQSISPIAKSAPLNGSLTLPPQDAQSNSRLQESLREARRQIDKLKERNATLESSRRQLEKDLAEVQGKLQSALKTKADVEHSRLQSETDIRTLQYRYEQENEARRVADALLSQLKEQIKRSDEKLAKEMDARQKLEVETRHLQKDAKNHVQILANQETDINQLQKALTEEQESRLRMTEMYNDLKKQMSVLMDEARTSTQEKAVVMAELEAVDQTRKTHEANSGSLRDQLMTAQTELAETRARLEATVISTDKELGMLREKLQKKADKLAKADEMIAELRSNNEANQASSSREHANLSTKLDSHVSEKKQMESEIASLKIRLENANNAIEKATSARSQAENATHSLRDELYQARLQLEKDIASLRESNQALSNKLEHAETKASSLDQELQLSTLTMTEKGGHLSLAQREVEHIKATLLRTEEKLAIEKGQNAKMSTKLEAAENKVLTLMSETDSLKRQLETSSEKVRKLEENSVRSEAKYHSTIDTLRADLEKNKELMADNKTSLAESMKMLKEDSNKISENNVRREEEIKILNQELNTATRKLAQTETALEMQSKARQELENERAKLREELRVFEAKLLVTEDSKEQFLGRANRLEEKLGQSMRASDDAAARLATRSADLESVSRSLSQLENLVNRLKFDKSQLATALKDEQVKSELLLKEIKDAHEARQSLEALLTNVKAENIQLEEKAQSDELNRTIYGKEAAEAKELWESELRARTKLGTKIVNAEKKLVEAQASLEEERRKTRKVLQMKKAVEAKLEAQDDRSAHHHKDILALKSQLKSYKRRLKEYETSEGRIPSMRNEFDKERAANESHISSLRRQIDNLTDKLRQEMETRTRLELTNKQQHHDLTTAKSNAKEMEFEQERLERANKQLEEELQRTTAYYEQNYVEKGELDAYRKELEAKSRFEINRKLEEVNQHLADESQLSRSRSSLHEHETQKDTISAEAKRYKELYESELNVKNKLTSKLAKANEKVAESKAILNIERSRRLQTADRDSGFVTSPKYSPDPLGSFISSRSPRSPARYDDDQLMKAVENELNKSIKRHLETGPVTTDLDLRPSPLNISDTETSSYPPLTHASKEYMSLLQKKYFV